MGQEVVVIPSYQMRVSESIAAGSVCVYLCVCVCECVCYLGRVRWHIHNPAAFYIQ